MKIYSTAPEGNEMAELANARYFNLAIEQIEKNVSWMKDTTQPVQALLTHIDILVMLSKRFPQDANLSVEQAKVAEWKQIFNDWFDRCGKKIPPKFRGGIKANGDELFAELEKYGY